MEEVDTEGYMGKLETENKELRGKYAKAVTDVSAVPDGGFLTGRLPTGDTPTGGAQVGGAQVGGAQVGGAPTGGAQVGGAQVGGAPAVSTPKYSLTGDRNADLKAAIEDMKGLGNYIRSLNSGLLHADKKVVKDKPHV